MTAYYNEWDKNAAAWLRELIKMGLIADGEVDERSITDVTAADLRGFTQHHFFAGIGVWSYSLRRAGWSDDMPVCTASLPCQPFSAAGKRKGKDDERHLLPHFLDLVKECGFPILFGEQVAPAIKQGWLDDLYDEMEQQGYICGSSVLTAAGAGSPHIRQRIYWTAARMGDTSNQGLQGQWGFKQVNGSPGREAKKRHSAEAGLVGGMGNTQHNGHDVAEAGRSTGESEAESGLLKPERPDSIEWLYCRDEKYRPIKSGITPLVDGPARGMGYRRDSSIPSNEDYEAAPEQEEISPNSTSEARVMRLKGYGNAIQADVATQFIGAVMECL